MEKTMKTPKWCFKAAVFTLVVWYANFGKADVLLDNTSQGTASLLGNGSDLDSLLIKQGLQFSIGTGYSFDLSNITLGLGPNPSGGGAPTVNVELWSWNGSGATSLGSGQTFTASSNTIGYYDFALTAPIFSNLASGDYVITVSSTDAYWWQSDSSTSPVAPTTGFSFVQYRRSTDGGVNWVDSNHQNSIFLQGTGSAGGASVPEPTSVVMISLGAAGAVLRSRNQLGMRLKRVMRRS